MWFCQSWVADFADFSGYADASWRVGRGLFLRKKAHVMKHSIVWAALLAVSGALFACPMAHAQRGGDSYSVRRFLGSDAYVFESFTRPRTKTPVSATQNPAAKQTMPTVSTPPVPEPPKMTSGTTNTLNYYGAAAARQTLAQMPRRTRFIPQGGSQVGVGAGAKPYAEAKTDPTISPYLNLFREERQDELPNYYTFVRPYQKQIETNRSQQRNIQNLQRQVQRTAYQTPVGTGGVPATGFHARFGDTGQYYGGWKK